MKVTLLGSGDWQGTPVVFCECRVCKHAIANPSSPENRTRPSLYVSTGNSHVLVEASPDLRLQAAKNQLSNKIRHIILSHWHFDHLFGLFELDAWVELFAPNTTIYCSEATAKKIEYFMPHIAFNTEIVKAFQTFSVGDIQVTPLPVYHMQEDADKDVADLDNTFGYIFESGNKKVAYLADYFKLPEETQQAISGCNTAVVDGTYLFEEDYPQKAYQQSFVSSGDPDHLHGQKIVDLKLSLNVKSVVYHSISHLPELLHDELQKKLPEGQIIGKDGYEL